jgi:hypothetical protein
VWAVATRVLVTLEELASKEPSQGTAKTALTTTRMGSSIAPTPVVKRPRSATVVLAAGVAPAAQVELMVVPAVSVETRVQAATAA